MDGSVTAWPERDLGWTCGLGYRAAVVVLVSDPPPKNANALMPWLLVSPERHLRLWDFQRSLQLAARPVMKP